MMFLTDEELRVLTGKVRPSTQLMVLRQRGIPHERDADGRPVVMRQALYDHMTGRTDGGPSHPPREPDFSDVA